MESKPKKEKRRKKKCHKLFFYITSTAKSYHKVLSEQAMSANPVIWLVTHAPARWPHVLHSRLRTLPVPRVLRFWKNLLKKRVFKDIYSNRRANKTAINLSQRQLVGQEDRRLHLHCCLQLQFPPLFCLCLISPVLLCLL